MRFVLLVHTGSGVVVYDAGSTPAKANALLIKHAQALAPKAVSLAILHPTRDLPAPG